MIQHQNTGNPVHTYHISSSAFFDVIGVGGYTKEELDRLSNLKQIEAMDQVLNDLGGIGVQIKCGYGIYGFKITDDRIELTIGNSCD